jgi:hypothetical protein
MVARDHNLRSKWLPVTIAPYDIDLEVGVLGKNGVAALAFPVRKEKFHWVNAKTKKLLDIEPTHWRPWRLDR